MKKYDETFEQSGVGRNLSDGDRGKGRDAGFKVKKSTLMAPNYHYVIKRIVFLI